jgi:hypothetical protein
MAINDFSYRLVPFPSWMQIWACIVQAVLNFQLQLQNLLQLLSLAPLPYLLETSLPAVFAVGDVRGAASSVSHLQSVKDRLHCINHNIHYFVGMQGISLVQKSLGIDN